MTAPMDTREGLQNARKLVTEEMVTVAMRAFERMSSVLRYREKDKWHACDIMGMRDAIAAALAAGSDAPAPETERLMQWITSLLNQIAKLETAALAQAAPDPLAGLAERLDRLWLTAADDNARFVLSAESAKNIVGIVGEWLRVKGASVSSTLRPSPDGAAREAREKEITRLATIAECARVAETSFAGSNLNNIAANIAENIRALSQPPQADGREDADV